ncbi:MAG: metallophosphoesterase family protein [Alphaproteobacteria bacterium]|jgi:serine/threonine protein phosphatase 1|nr:serine/threonine protein phosphatase [Rhodospirillaceae bacterium]MDG2481543.1 metallophosphoesterase family protein [Alphaproteobacteria bacterium]MBT6202308.1 serine/threonine protein phosphatase [Rhodospirillaceae bacterium]MBT6512591.1 serine/threonine protein phosphatase [Rhodospirillaceae bacterium]MBT7614901.1 serine/threonine protein phosphatase [Rhodospirillaceae bacterium]
MFRRLFGSKEKEQVVPLSERHIGDDTVVYSVGDIHGRVELLERLHDKICADAAGRSETRKVLVYLGDYVDRGLESRQVIEHLLAQGGDDLERVFLKGNHEDAMLRFLDETGIGRSWMGFGGDATLYSYGVDVFGAPPDGVDRMDHIQAQLREKLPQEHIAFLESLTLYHQEGGFFFAHAGVKPGQPLHQQDPNDLMWIRDEFLDSRSEFGKVIVHGHTIQPQPMVRPNRIGIDTGAFASGVLTCLVLSGAEHSFIQTP